MDRMRAPFVVANPVGVLASIPRTYTKNLSLRTGTNYETNSGAPHRTIRSQRAPCTNHAGARIQEAFRALPGDIFTILPLGNILVTRRDLADRNALTRQHALVHNGISVEEEKIGGHETKWRRDQVDDVSDYQLARILLNPCQGRERSTEKSDGIRIELTCAVDEYVHRTGESRHLPHPLDGLESKLQFTNSLQTEKDTTFLVSTKVVTMLITEIKAIQKA